ncbi:MAG: SIMPL domain-containing protein [Patescibacteria group bacterium]
MEKLFTTYQKKIGLILTLTGVLLIALIVFLASLTLNTLEERKYISEPRASITASGEGSAVAVPDIAEFNFSVKYEADSVPEAQEEVSEKMEEITSFLKDEGVEDRYIKTSGYSAQPRYEWRARSELSSGNGRERVLVGYEVIHTTEVKVKEMDKAGSLVGGVGDRGATDISGIRFSVEDEEELKREARKEAIEEAKEEARRLSNDLDVELVRIVSFNESRRSPSYPERGLMMEDSAQDEAGAEPSFEPGEEEVKSNVEIKYEIR